MAVVLVAGGLGDLGRVITDALYERGKHEVYVMSRKGTAKQTRISPLTGKDYNPIIETNYSENSLVEQLSEKQIMVVICAFIMDSESTCAAQIQLIRAAERCECVRRFIPSEFNVEYDVGDDVLPYPEKEFHLRARTELSYTRTLEYAYVYPGMFMDYFGMPHVATQLRPLYFFIDPASGQAVLPGDGEAKMSMTFSSDAARYIALALDLAKWPRILTTVTSTVTLNELVGLAQKNLGCALAVRYQPVENLLRHEPLADLPGNIDIAATYPGRFPGGLRQLRALIADLEAGVALGAYDLTRLVDKQQDCLDLVRAFEGLEGVSPPKGIEEFMAEAWGKGAT
ncbi:NAD(P)-binding protein [Nemania abortiva]|nr:NAD(P)-binding protein [Nemania abortiva]